MPPWVSAALNLGKRIPWKRVFKATVWLVTAGRKYWDRLTPDERQEFLALTWKWRGRPPNLTKKEQARLNELFQKLRQSPKGDG
jgi:hypothetical protein